MKIAKLFYLTLMLLVVGFSTMAQNESTVIDHTENITQDVIWHVKALHTDGYTMDVKAIDDENNLYDIKAIENSNQRYIMDVKAFVGKKIFPVKVLVSEDEYKPVCATNGVTYKNECEFKNVICG